LSVGLLSGQDLRPLRWDATVEVLGDYHRGGIVVFRDARRMWWPASRLRSGAVWRSWPARLFARPTSDAPAPGTGAPVVIDLRDEVVADYLEPEAVAPRR
jgi:hypothetical protein